MKNQELENITTAIGKFVLEDEKFKKYRWNGTWISGESTEVYPVECSYDRCSETYYVEVQLDTSYRYWYSKVKGLISRVQKKFSQYKIKPNIYRYDGSCPDALTLCVYKK